MPTLDRIASILVLASEDTVVDTAGKKLHEAKQEAVTWIEQAKTMAVEFTPKVLGGVVILIITWILAGWARSVLVRLLERGKIDTTLVRFLSNTARYIVIVLGVLACLSTFGLNVTSFIAILSAVSLAVGLALQGSLSHIASGVMLLIFRPFKVGDVVTVAGATGAVDAIDLFATTLDTPDRKRIIIPNGAIYGTTITNFTHHPVRIASAKVAVALGSDPDRVRQTLIEVARGVIESGRGGLAQPAPSAGLVEFAGGAQVWSVSAACSTPKFDAVCENLTLAAAAAIHANGLSPASPVTLVKNV